MVPRIDGRGVLNPAVVADEVAAAVLIMSRHRIGAVILVDPAVAVERGVLLDALVTRELLVALFVPERLNRLHAGAVIIRGNRVERAGVPISWAEVIERAAELAGIAVAVDGDDGEIRTSDRTGHVEVDELTDVLRRHAREADHC